MEDVWYATFAPLTPNCVCVVVVVTLKSVENALVIMNSSQVPFIIDPTTQAVQWLRTHLKVTRRCIRGVRCAERILCVLLCEWDVCVICARVRSVYIARAP